MFPYVSLCFPEIRNFSLQQLTIFHHRHCRASSLDLSLENLRTAPVDEQVVTVGKRGHRGTG